MNIVVGYIPREEGLAALQHATQIAEREEARVVVVNSGVHGNDNDPSFASAADLDAISERLRQRGIEHQIEQPVAADYPADEILKAASAVDADLIVIGLRRRPLVGKVFLGSTVQQIITEAQCPVVTVKQSPS
jgi:nucleotide-binding universal stress UspA family protein